MKMSDKTLAGRHVVRGGGITVHLFVARSSGPNGFIKRYRGKYLATYQYVHDDFTRLRQVHHG